MRTFVLADSDPYEWTNLVAKTEHARLKADLAKHFPTTNLPAAGSRDKEKRGKNKKARSELQ